MSIIDILPPAYNCNGLLSTDPWLFISAHIQESDLMWIVALVACAHKFQVLEPDYLL